MTQGPTRAYITFDPKQGYPAALDIAYECLVCGGVLDSMGDAGECKCDNISVDPDAGRVFVRDSTRMKAFRR